MPLKVRYAAYVAYKCFSTAPSSSYTDFIQKLLLIDRLMCVAVVGLSYFTFMFYYFITFYCQVAFVMMMICQFVPSQAFLNNLELLAYSYR